MKNWIKRLTKITEEDFATMDVGELIMHIDTNTAEPDTFMRFIEETDSHPKLIIYTNSMGRFERSLEGWYFWEDYEQTDEFKLLKTFEDLNIEYELNEIFSNKLEIVIHATHKNEIATIFIFNNRKLEEIK